MIENKLKAGASTFCIADPALNHRDDDPFVLFLKSEGYKLQMFGHPNADHCLYVNVESKVYNWGMAGVKLAPIIFDHAIHIDEFMTIYNIFKKYEGLPVTYYTMEQYRKVFGDDDSYLKKLRRLSEEEIEDALAPEHLTPIEKMQVEAWTANGLTRERMAELLIEEM